MYWLPPTLRENDSVTRSGPLSQHFATVFRNAGFSHHICLCRYNKDRSICRIEFRCTHGKLYQTQRDLTKKNKVNSRTRRPLTHEGKCPFKISVYYSSLHHRFFLPAQSGGCLSHSGHLKLLPHEVPSTTAHVDSHHMEETLRQLQLQIPTNIIKTLLQDKTNAVLQPRQLRHLRELSLDRDVFNDDGELTSARKLINFLHNCPTVEYITYTAERQHASNLVTLRKKKRRSGSSILEETVDVVAPSSSQDAATHASMLLDALSIDKAGEEILLVAAWATHSGMRLFEMYPERIGFDTTHKTNNEERPHFRGTIIDSSGKNVPVFEAFLPSEARHVFNFLFFEAFPFLFGAENCKKIQLVITDQDELCLSQLQAAKDSMIYPQMNIRLCHWHKVNRGFEVQARKRCNTSSCVDKTVLRCFVQWLYSLSTTLRSKKQMRHSKLLMFRWVDAQKISPSLKRWMYDFWRNHYNPVIHYLGQWNYRGVFGANLRSNSFQESENRALKYDYRGPSAQHGIHRAASLTVDHVTNRHTNLSRIASVELNTTQVPNGPADDYVWKLSKDFCPKVVSELSSQYQQRVNYRHLRQGNKWFVRRAVWQTHNYIPANPNYYKMVVPSYDQTNVVRLDNTCLWCSCLHFQEQGIACRHIYAVLDETPSLIHAIPEKTKAYQSQYAVNEPLTSAFRNRAGIRPRGPLCNPNIPFVFNKTRESHDIDFFMQAMPSEEPILRPGLVHSEVPDVLEEAKEEMESELERTLSQSEHQRHTYQSLSQILSRRVDLVDNDEDADFLYERDMESYRQLLKRRRERKEGSTMAVKRDEGMVDLPIIHAPRQRYTLKKKVGKRYKPVCD